MRSVLQRASSARVTVDGRVVGEIGKGLAVLVGVADGDGEEDAAWTARKIAELRIFEDGDGKMNLSVEDVGGAALVVSQFTLLADCRKGRRPSFVGAADPDEGRRLYERVAALLEDRGLSVATGVFGARMLVEIENDGPVTIVLDSPVPGGEEGGR
ncbi:MAG: D-tyrosyl-tRNA(Tyr) deacylase [Candidatus Eisenbacteria bacterium]|nr:D-tyrosyl-tRNA(Tyr) deacylase [Candidatus Eisenbacteria bacterium]